MGTCNEARCVRLSARRLLLALALVHAGDGAHVRGVLRSVEIKPSITHPLLKDQEEKLEKQVRNRTKQITGDRDETQDHPEWLCDITFSVTSHSVHRPGVFQDVQQCPDACPFLAQDKLDTEHCTFRCVVEKDCVVWSPENPIGDKDKWLCRRPMVQACSEYVLDGTDRCKKCDNFFWLTSDGQCESDFIIPLCILAAVLLIVAFFVLFWVLDLALRPCVNELGLLQGLEHRSRQKLHQPKALDPERDLWPLTTNLMRVPVAGPGLLLHFRFQFRVILWALLIAIFWMCLCQFVDRDLYVLGTRKMGTPLQNCIVVKWGHETQQRTKWIKLTFIGAVYLITFIFSIIHSILQLRAFQTLDSEHSTMKDYTAKFRGLHSGPDGPVKGACRLEEELKTAIENACGQQIIGVSPAWIYKVHKEKVDALVTQDIEEREAAFRETMAFSRRETEEVEEAAAPPAYREKLLAVERNIVVGDQEAVADSKEAIVELLESLEVSDEGFVVFETEEARDAGIAKVKECDGIEFRGARIHLEEGTCEPEVVNWFNFGRTTWWDKLFRAIKGIGYIMIALTAWTVVFYLPYAWSIYNFNYDNGQEPGFVYSIAFTMVVVIGNATMYEVCARISDHIGFQTRDEREAAYMLLYTTACLCNVLMDFVTTFIMAKSIMTELGSRTYSGVALSELNSFTELFESYPIQRSLAENTYRYAFPSTYLIPFLLEPFATIYLPFRIGLWIVKSHPQLVGRGAEEWLSCIQMDLGRYADILLNMLLGVLIFYFPGGWNHWLFIGMAVSHMWIYCFDHGKVLRSIVACQYSSMDIDWWSQLMLAPVCALILSCFMFTLNWYRCHRGIQPCLTGFWLIGNTVLVFALHCIVHISIVVHVVPLFGRPHEIVEPKKYPEVAASTPSSFFSTNPVHCLRSKYIYEHEKPCVYFASGKEHHMLANAAIGLYFEGDPTEVEDFSFHFANWRQAREVSKSAMAAAEEARSRSNSKAPLSDFGDGDVRAVPPPAVPPPVDSPEGRGADGA